MTAILEMLVDGTITGLLDNLLCALTTICVEDVAPQTMIVHVIFLTAPLKRCSIADLVARAHAAPSICATRFCRRVMTSVGFPTALGA